MGASWPHLARLLTVIGLFLVVSWAGLWLALPFVARAVGLGLFVLLALGALFPLVRFRWPSREEALSRLDRGSGIRHRPATALTDTLATQDPVALALWQAQRERTLASIKRIRAGLPSPRLAIHDPWALRALVVVMMVATYVAAGDERSLRIAAAFDWNGVLAPANIRVDAWVTPPLYTGKPPIILSAANKEAAVPRQRPVAGSGGQHADRALQRRHARCRGRRRRDRSARRPSRRPRAPTSGISPSPATAPRMSARPPASRNGSSPPCPTAPPTIALAKDPERQARGSLQMSYKLEDDYGVTEAQAHFAARPARGAEGRRSAAAAVRRRRNFRWCCRMRGPATASARPSRISARTPMPAPTSR